MVEDVERKRVIMVCTLTQNASREMAPVGMELESTGEKKEERETYEGFE